MSCLQSCGYLKDVRSSKIEALEINQAMEVEKMSNLAFLLVLALCMSQPLITNASWFFQRSVVHIENRLSSHTLKAHCWTHDIDIFQHISLGEQFQFGFYNSIWETSYMCNLSWPGGQVTFEAYNSAHYICEPWHSVEDLNCVWRAQDDGVYFLNTEKRKYYFMGTWEH